MQLSDHFTLEELTFTQVRDVDNIPPRDVVEALRETTVCMEEVRALLGHPIIVKSGYRSPTVNKIVGGVPDSAHIRGRAVDFICPDYGSPYEVANMISRSKLLFDQLIREYGWVHLAFEIPWRQDVLTKVSASSPYVRGLAA